MYSWIRWGNDNYHGYDGYDSYHEIYHDNLYRTCNWCYRL
jgi:hypothetical protein